MAMSSAPGDPGAGRQKPLHGTALICGSRAKAVARHLLIAALPLCLAAMPVLAQDTPPAEPQADTSIVEACLENLGIAADDDAPFAPARCIGVAASACMDSPGGSSTAGMIACSQQELAFWDAKLNSAYQGLLAQAKAVDAEDPSASPTQTELLRETQRNWIAFRDTSCAWEADLYRGGSIQGPVSATCNLHLTATQALRLDALNAPAR